MYGHFTKGVDLAYWWSCIGKGLRLQPAQQACFPLYIFLCDVCSGLNSEIILKNQFLICLVGLGSPDNCVYWKLATANALVNQLKN